MTIVGSECSLTHLATRYPFTAVRLEQVLIDGTVLPRATLFPVSRTMLPLSPVLLHAPARILGDTIYNKKRDIEL